jgi:threonine/homoserine/homoserine lactone efflux protein
MQTSLTLHSSAALFSIMLIAALIPSISVLAVSARSVTAGFIHGVFTTMGIVVGDIIFILLAIFGLSFLAETMGSAFVLIKYLGGAYLIWLGLVLWRSEAKAMKVEGDIDSSLLSSFLTGLFITLGDQKAILFYFSFFPAFIDLSTISYFDTGLIITIATIAIVCAKLGYALMAIKARLIFKNTRFVKKINMAAGTVMIAAGVFLVAKTLIKTK